MNYRNPDRADSYKQRVTVLSLEATLIPGIRALQFQAVIKPAPPTSKKAPAKKENYTTTIRFMEISTYKERINTKHAELEQDGQKLYHPVPHIRKNGVLMKCTCQDFRFSFEKQNYDAGGLLGNWRRYKRKTSPSTRPANAKNPNDQGKDFVNALPNGSDTTTGYCKHINGLLKLLYQQKKVSQ